MQWRRGANPNHDPLLEKALDSSQELNQHLSKSVAMLRAQEEHESATLLPAVAFPERKLMTAPAPGSFSAQIKAMMDEARNGIAQARADGVAKVGEAVSKLNEAKVATTKVAGAMAKTVEDEAAEVMSELGQISNDLGV